MQLFFIGESITIFDQPSHIHVLAAATPSYETILPNAKYDSPDDTSRTGCVFILGLLQGDGAPIYLDSYASACRARPCSCIPCMIPLTVSNVHMVVIADGTARIRFVPMP